jgi:hypothetical protein
LVHSRGILGPFIYFAKKMENDRMKPLSYLFSLLLCTTLSQICVAQVKHKITCEPSPKNYKHDITNVSVCHDETGRKITRLEIELQGGTGDKDKDKNNMEPVAEPRRIRINDRSQVQFLIKNISPLDVCSRNAGTPTANAETPVIESLVGTLAKYNLGYGFAGDLASKNTEQMKMMSANFSLKISQIENLKSDSSHQVADDPEYKAIIKASKEFVDGSLCLMEGPEKGPKEERKCPANQPVQVTLSTQIDNAGRKLIDFESSDYRNASYVKFVVAENKELDMVRNAFNLPLSTIDGAGNLQAIADEMGTWARDLHKKYDYAGSAFKDEKEKRPDQDDLDALLLIDQIVDRANAAMSLIGDNNKALEAAQLSLKTNYVALRKIEDDFSRRQTQKIVYELSEDDHKILVQEFNLGPDRKVTSPGTFSCVSDVDGKTPTTTNINYSLLYQDVPHWSASTGFLNSFQEKKVFGVVNQSNVGSNPPTSSPFFQVTDRAQAQLIPMAYVNYRFHHFWTSHYGRTKEDELVWTANLSGGFGVNSNTGTNQPEFFTGFALGLNHFMLHPGIHWGRTESLGGNFHEFDQAPMGVTSPPVTFGYHPALSIGLSVRVAPY